MDRAVVASVDWQGGHGRRVLTFAENRGRRCHTVQARSLMGSSAQSLTGTRPLLWLGSCSWCCGDLTPSVPQAGLQRICIYCGRPELVTRQGQQRRYVRIRDYALPCLKPAAQTDETEAGTSCKSGHVAEDIMSSYAITASAQYRRGAAREARCRD